jgi:hypothetical protein
VIIAVKLNIVERRCHAVPPGHRGSLQAAHVRHRRHNHISSAQRPAYQDNLELNRGADGELFGAQKIHAGRADVTRYQSDWVFLRHSSNCPESQRKFQSGPGILALLGVDAYGVSGYADETPWLRRAQ